MSSEKEKKSSSSKDMKATAKEEEIPVSTKAMSDVGDVVKDNTIRFIDEIAKIQPQMSQSISNLRMDYIQTTKNVVSSILSTQKEITSTMNFPQMPAPVTEQLARQAEVITDNIIGASTIYNQMTMKSLDAARENVKIYDKTVSAIADYHANIAKAWSSFWASQQQLLRI